MTAHYVFFCLTLVVVVSSQDGVGSRGSLACVFFFSLRFVRLPFGAKTRAFEVVAAIYTMRRKRP
jgi:hypothetical protein